MEARTVALVQEINGLQELVANGKSLEIIRKMLATKSIHEDMRRKVMSAVLANINQFAPQHFGTAICAVAPLVEQPSAWHEKFRKQVNAFDVPDRFGWLQANFESYVAMVEAEAEADKEEANLDKLLDEFWEDVMCTRGLIANQESFAEICSALQTPGLRCEVKTYTMEAFFINIGDYGGAQGKFVSAMLKLLDQKSPKVAACLASLISKCTKFVARDEEAIAKCSADQRRAIAEALETSNKQFDDVLEPSNQQDLFAEQRPKFRAFLEASLKIGKGSAAVRCEKKSQSVRSKYKKGLLDTVTSGEKLVVEFVVAEIAACRSLVLTPVEFRRFAKRLQASRVIEKEKVMLLKSILDNATEFGK